MIGTIVLVVVCVSLLAVAVAVGADVIVPAGREARELGRAIRRHARRRVRLESRSSPDALDALSSNAARLADQVREFLQRPPGAPDRKD